MTEGVLFILGGFLLWQALQIELLQRRSIARDDKLMAIVKRLEDRIHAKDLSTYMDLRAEDKKPDRPPAPPLEHAALEEEGRYFHGNGM